MSRDDSRARVSVTRLEPKGLRVNKLRLSDQDAQALERNRHLVKQLTLNYSSRKPFVSLEFDGGDTRLGG